MNNSIEDLRKQSGLTQEELASICNISVLSMLRYEKKRRTPPVDVAINIAESVGIKTFEEFKAIFGAGTPSIENKPDCNQV